VDPGLARALGAEAVGTFWEVVRTAILLFVIMAVATDTRATGEAAAIAIGGTIALASLVGGPVSGASMNPARSLGPAIASGYASSLWVYLTAPLVGGALGAFAYQLVRGKSGYYAEAMREHLDRVRAAGGLVVREGPKGPEILVVHRPKYEDWTFPKGKTEAGESDEECALREVEEETGLRCGLREELPSTSYTDAQGRPKRVRYWLMDPIGGELAFRHEVDEARWVSPDEALRLLTYDRDVTLLQGVPALAGRRTA
jgi:8-oxo-dGTP pyrophosphatase MutT (NUDIX family)